MDKKTFANNVYNPLFTMCVLGKSYGFPSGSFSFANLVLNQNNVPYTNTLATIVHEQNSSFYIKLSLSTNVSDFFLIFFHLSFFGELNAFVVGALL